MRDGVVIERAARHLSISFMTTNRGLPQSVERLPRPGSSAQRLTSGGLRTQLEVTSIWRRHFAQPRVRRRPVAINRRCNEPFNRQYLIDLFDRRLNRLPTRIGRDSSLICGFCRNSNTRPRLNDMRRRVPASLCGEFRSANCIRRLARKDIIGRRRECRSVSSPDQTDFYWQEKSDVGSSGEAVERRTRRPRAFAGAAIKERRVEVRRTEFSREMRHELEGEEKQIEDLLDKLTRAVES